MKFYINKDSNLSDYFIGSEEEAQKEGKPALKFSTSEIENSIECKVGVAFTCLNFDTGGVHFVKNGEKSVVFYPTDEELEENLKDKEEVTVDDMFNAAVVKGPFEQGDKGFATTTMMVMDGVMQLVFIMQFSPDEFTSQILTNETETLRLNFDSVVTTYDSRIFEAAFSEQMKDVVDGVSGEVCLRVVSSYRLRFMQEFTYEDLLKIFIEKMNKQSEDSAAEGEEEVREVEGELVDDIEGQAV